MFVYDYGIWILRYANYYERKVNNTDESYETLSIGNPLFLSLKYVFQVNGKKILSVTAKRISQNIFAPSFTSPDGFKHSSIAWLRSGPDVKYPRFRYKGRDPNFCKDFRLPIYSWVIEGIQKLEKYHKTSGLLPPEMTNPELHILKKALINDFENITNQNEFELIE